MNLSGSTTVCLEVLSLPDVDVYVSETDDSTNVPLSTDNVVVEDDIWKLLYDQERVKQRESESNRISAKHHEQSLCD